MASLGIGSRHSPFAHVWLVGPALHPKPKGYELVIQATAAESDQLEELIGKGRVTFYRAGEGQMIASSHGLHQPSVVQTPAFSYDVFPVMISVEAWVRASRHSVSDMLAIAASPAPVVGWMACSNHKTQAFAAPSLSPTSSAAQGERLPPFPHFRRGRLGPYPDPLPAARYRLYPGLHLSEGFFLSRSPLSVSGAMALRLGGPAMSQSLPPALRLAASAAFLASDAATAIS
mmetsp:Transcript_127465/g.221040  ORF Transcript_127465/g.221040 Transcript_127465/m.221040 type:complete len:231 (+) Transcript_127465:214-906(+)